MANLNTVTLTIDSSTQIYQLDPNKIIYIDKENTPCFLWKVTWESDIQILFPTSLKIQQRQASK